MKETTYKCDICGKACNGGGYSYSVIPGRDSYMDICISKTPEKFESHVCGQEHFMQMVSQILQEMEGKL